MSADHLRQMKRRLGMAPPSSSLGLEPAAEKMDMLEKTLNAFRTEVDMKLKIIQQILTTRNEQVTVQKKLLDREQSLYNTLLAHWLNTADLAASGVSMNFSADLTESLDTEDLDFDFSDDNFDLTASPGDGTSSGAPATKKPRRRHRKISKVTKTEPRADGTTEVTEELDGASDPLDQRYEHNYDDDGDRDEEWVPSGNMETIEGEHGNEHNEESSVRTKERRDRSRSGVKRGEGLIYTKAMTFPDEETLQSFLQTEDIWRRYSRSETSEGKKVYMYCRLSNRCQRRIYLLYRPNTDEISLYETVNGHSNHEDYEERLRTKQGIHPVIKQKIKDLYYNHGITKPKPILRALSEAGFDQPTLPQINTFLNVFRKLKRESEDWQNDPSPPIKRQRQSHNWTRVKRFATGKEALDFIREEKLWRACGKNEGLQGRKISYNCKFSKLCGAKAYILFKRDSEDAEVYKTTSEHTHSDPKRRGLTESTKEKVIQLISDGLSKPKIILSTLRECGLEEPPAKVLINFLSSIRNKQSPKAHAKSSHYLESAPHKTSIGFGVHVSSEFLAITRTSANTKNVYARNLFKHLYKPSEIVGHSLMGKTCNANKNDFPLPSIEPRRRDAIIEHSLQVFGIKLGSEEYRLARRDIKKTLSCLIKEMSKI